MSPAAGVSLRLVPALPRGTRFYASEGASAGSNILYRPYRLPSRMVHRLGWLAHRGRLTPSRTFVLEELGIGDDHDLEEIVVSDEPPRQRTRTVLPRQGLIVKCAPVAALATEAEMLERLDTVPALGLAVPELLERRQHGDRLALSITILGSDEDRRRSPITAEEVLRVAILLARADITHGDLTPWNVVRVGGGLGLCDWEHAAPGLRPGLDLTHAVLQAAVFRYGWSAAQCVERLVGEGGLGRRYCDEIGVPFDRYLDTVRAYLDDPGFLWSLHGPSQALRAEVATALSRH